jgi:hypothetical protein
MRITVKHYFDGFNSTMPLSQPKLASAYNNHFPVSLPVNSCGSLLHEHLFMKTELHVLHSCTKDINVTFTPAEDLLWTLIPHEILENWSSFVYTMKGYISSSSSSSSFLGSIAQLRPWPPPQNPAEFLGGFSTIFFFTG